MSLAHRFPHLAEFRNPFVACVESLAQLSHISQLTTNLSQQSGVTLNQHCDIVKCVEIRV